MFPPHPRHAMKTSRSRSSRTKLWAGLLAVLIVFNFGPAAWALAGTATNAPSAPAATANTVAIPATNAAPKPTDADDEDDTGSGRHSFKLDINTNHDPSDSGLMGEFLDDLIPLAGIIATFATPILIVFFICYFKYRRRQENLALAREFLSKGLPVPPELLDPTQAGVDISIRRRGAEGYSGDLRKGFRLTFIGLGLALAFWVTSPHSTTWGWGLIPMIMGIGFLISGWVGSRRDFTSRDAPPTPPSSWRNPP